MSYRACIACGRPAEPGASRCKGCAVSGWRSVSTEARRRYDDRRWKALRASHLGAYPNCARCGRPATVADHIVAVADHPAGFLDPANVQSLCGDCHKLKTAEDNRRRRKR